MKVPSTFCALIFVALSTAEWMDTPRYGAKYVRGYQMEESSMRTVRCTPCDERRSSSRNLLDDYRGNGADNLGYDWSPKAWGGLAFPNKAKGNRPNDDWDGGRGGRQMPGRWGERDGCSGCNAGRDWDRYTERPRDWDDRERGRWGSSTDRPNDWSRGTTGPADTTVTSPVIGVMYKNDKRLSVSWEGDGRSMRWDGFRNGIGWDLPTQMDRRSWDDEKSFRPWDDTGKGVSGWDSQGKGHYASRWSYGSAPQQGWNDPKWNRPWSASDQRGSGDRGYGQGGNLPFGSSYPQSSNNYPSSSSSSHYPNDRPSYSTGSWSQPTTSYPQKGNYYPTTSRPYQPYPDTNTQRPSYQEVTPRPGYQTTSQYQPPRPSHRPQDPWNYDSNRPSGQWTTPPPSQNYLPQSPRPPARPGYDQPPAGVPSITIWNGRPGGPNEYDSRPGSKPPKGFYQGFITEIHDGNYVGGNKYPSDRPPTGYPSRPGGDRYPSSGDDRYPAIGGNRYPSSGGDRYPSSGSDRYPSIGGDRYPSSGGDRYPSGSHNRYPSGSTVRYPDNNRYPSNPWYPNNQDRYPGIGGNRYPTNDHDRYPSSDGNRYPSHEPNPRPGSDSGYNRPGDSDRNPWYETDRNRPNYDNRYPTNDNKYPDRDRYPSGDRYPNYEGDRIPNYNSDRNPNGNRHGIYDKDRYPSRPGSSDHDRGPNPNNDPGAWNYGEDEHKDGTYRRSGGSYPTYKGGKYYTSSYLASASTPASSHDLEGKKPENDETTPTTSQEQ